MAFVLKLNPTYRRDVSFKVPGDDGDYPELTFKAVYKRATSDWLVKINEKIEADSVKQDELISEVLVGWEGIKDPADPEKDLEFSPKAVKELLKITGAGAAIVREFFASVNGAFEGN